MEYDTRSGSKWLSLVDVPKNPFVFNGVAIFFESGINSCPLDVWIHWDCENQVAHFVLDGFKCSLIT
jgi:hypothetical protein